MKTMRVNTIYGADGSLRTSYFENKSAKLARKNVKAFNKQLSKYDKDFINYAMLDIEQANMYEKNEKYILGKLKVADAYVHHIPAGDMAECMGDEMTAIAGNKRASKLGIGAKTAGVFQPFMEKQAAKHPRLQKLSDCVTKAANDGRMPLTAESAAVMRIAFDKKYYEDSRKPGVDKELLKDIHDKAVGNLSKMARYDGVEPDELSKAFSKKLIEQMQVNEGLSDIYGGMATGSIRLGPDEPMLDNKGDPITVKGKTLYRQSTEFVSDMRDEKGHLIRLDAWDFEPREPQSVETTVADYKSQFDKFASKCETEADLKRFLASNSYANIERNAKTFAEADCPDDAERFKYEFARANIAACQKWGIDHGYKMPYANLVVPPPYENYAKDSSFVRAYTTADYDSLDDVHDKAVEDIKETADDDNKLAEVLEDDVNKMSVDADFKALVERMNALEAENNALKKQLADMESKVVETTSSDSVYYAEETTVEDTKSKMPKFSKSDFINAAMNTASVAMNVASFIRDNYKADSKVIASTSNLDKLRQRQQPAAVQTDYEPPKYIETTIVEPEPEPKEFKTSVDDFGLNIDFKEINAVTVIEDVHIPGDEWYDIEHRIYYDAENDCLKQRVACPGQRTYEDEMSLEDANKYINDSLYNNMSRDKRMDVYIEDSDGVRSTLDAKSLYEQQMGVKQPPAVQSTSKYQNMTMGTYSDKLSHDDDEDEDDADYDYE